MYGMMGGCTTLFHLAVAHPLLIAFALGLGGLGRLHSQPIGPGDRVGAESAFVQMENRLMRVTPGARLELEGLRREFEALEPEPTEEQVRQVLKFTDACTNASVENVMKDKAMRKEAAWLVFLDAYKTKGVGYAKSILRRARLPPG